jgi:hypothetical protein
MQVMQVMQVVQVGQVKNLIYLTFKITPETNTWFTLLIRLPGFLNILNPNFLNAGIAPSLMEYRRALRFSLSRLRISTDRKTRIKGNLNSCTCWAT